MNVLWKMPRNAARKSYETSRNWKTAGSPEDCMKAMQSDRQKSI
jgi:hypothetical protein